MKTRWVISLVVVAAFMLFSPPAIADDLAELKATNQSFWKAWNTGDVETFMGIWQDGAVWLSANRSFPMVVNVAMGLKMWPKIFETHTVRIRWHQTEYRIFGNTGLVWGLFEHVVRNKGTGIGKADYRQACLTFVKSEGKWKLVVASSALVTSERDLF
jgi:ketosteroid isomerase-like protein